MRRVCIFVLSFLLLFCFPVTTFAADVTWTDVSVNYLFTYTGNNDAILDTYAGHAYLISSSSTGTSSQVSSPATYVFALPFTIRLTGIPDDSTVKGNVGGSIKWTPQLGYYNNGTWTTISSNSFALRGVRPVFQTFSEGVTAFPTYNVETSMTFYMGISQTYYSGSVPFCTGTIYFTYISNGDFQFDSNIHLKVNVTSNSGTGTLKRTAGDISNPSGVIEDVGNAQMTQADKIAASQAAQSSKEHKEQMSQADKIASAQASQASREHDEVVNGYDDSSGKDANASLENGLASYESEEAQAQADFNEKMDDYTNPDTSQYIQGISFISSAVVMWWDGLGIFKIILLVGFSLMIFNYISRFRGG